MSQPDGDSNAEGRDPLDDLHRPGGGTTSSALRTQEERLALFLENLSREGSIRKACATAGVSRSNIARLRETNEEFRAKFDEANEDYADRLRDALHKRAVEGWQEDVFGKEGKLGSRVLFSDRLLALALQAKCAEFRPKLELSATTDAMELARKIREADLRVRATVPPPPTE